MQVYSERCFILLFLFITSLGVQRVSTSRCGVGSFFSSRQNNGNGSAHIYIGDGETPQRKKKKEKKVNSFVPIFSRDERQ